MSESNSVGKRFMMRLFRRRGILTWSVCVAVASWVVVAAMCVPATAEDWPTYRHDNARSGSTAELLAPPLAEQWVFTATHAPEPAWPEPVKEMPRVRFDDVYHIAAVGDAVYFGSSADNKVYALDATTGNVRWSSFTGAPVRLAPTVQYGRVYVGSDDGHAYCLRANDGEIVWRVRAGYDTAQLLGNGEMMSMWPLRTSVLVDDGIAYFGAGVFPHENLFMCAVRADDGEIVWRNDTCGENGVELEFGGMSPQGYLLASESTLYVPSGRAMPAAFDRKDGRFLYFCSAGGKVGGTWALLTEDRLVAGVEELKLYDKETGRRTDDAEYAWFPGVSLVVTDAYSYLLTDWELCSLDRAAYRFASEWRQSVVGERDKLTRELADLVRRRLRTSGEAREAADKRIAELTDKVKALTEQQKKVEDAVHRWRRPCRNYSSVILAGDVLYAGGDGVVIAVDAANGEQLWKAEVTGMASGLAVANGRLFVSTDAGRIYCFGKGAVPTAREIKPAINASPYPSDKLTPVYERAADRIVKESGVKKGYCLVYGSGTGRLAFELAKRTDLKIVGIEPDAGKVASAREALDDAGLYGARITVEHGSLTDLPYSDYFANLVVSDTMIVSGDPQGSSAEMFRVLKPCGGVAYIGQPKGASDVVRPLDSAELRSWLQESGAPSAEVTDRDGTWMKIVRGPLPGAGKWTHQYADVANTACSDDQLVKGTLGVLWFGRPGPEKMVERHARAAGPVAMDGRLFVQGENVIMAYDSFNGVLLWEREIPGAVRVRVDSDTDNLALEKDGLYIVADDKCLRLDPATGKTIRTYDLPAAEDKKPRRWGYVACIGNTLYGTRAQPLREEYGATWDQLVNDDGTWQSPNEIAPSRSMMYGNYIAEFPEPDRRAFADFQYAGGMWRYMELWPAWGSVSTPQGAITSRIMASDALFALDANTGKQRWIYDGRQIAHPAITIGDRTVFFADCDVTDEQKAAAIREKRELIARGIWEKGLDIEMDPDNADVRRVVALDAATGAKRWERIVDLTGCGGDRMGMAYQDGILLFFGCFSNHDSGLFRQGALKWRRITAVAAADGSDIWSRPLDYLRRPVVMGDTILIEPRACDVRTGEIKTRVHPLTGKEETWEFVRPGHCCSVTSASPNMFFLRGYFLWYYDMEKDQGMLPFGGIRPGCWINTIPADGLLLFPEASAGCRCSYPVRATVVMKPKPAEEYRTWSILIQHGDMTPVEHMAVNLGAPGDWRDDDGTLWFCYPHPRGNSFFTYGVNFDLEAEFLPDMGYFNRDFHGMQIERTEKPWLYASGCSGLTSCELPLIGEGQESARYTVRLYFVDTENDTAGQRTFHVKLQGRTALRNFDIVAEAGGPNVAVVKEFDRIKVRDTLEIELIPTVDNPTKEQAPLINGIEVIRES